ncbi:MAG TPA: CHAT domain-containing protein [Blastocatellia bacterium]|nr:CHAT domain-containing protein [Blastocatellia bacterium]
MDSRVIFTSCLVLFLQAEITATDFVSLPGLRAAMQKDSMPNPQKLFDESTELAENALYEESWLRLVEAIELWRKAGATDKAVTALLKAAEYHKAAARWQIALDCYQLLLKLRPVSLQLRAGALDSMARIYLLLGQLELSEANYLQASRIAEQVGDRSMKAELMASLAALCARSGRYKEATAYLRKAQLFQPAQANGRKAATRQLVGQVYYLLGQFQKAREAFEQALSLNRRTGADREAESLLLCYLSNIHLKFDQKDLALDCAMRALTIAVSLQSIEAQCRAQLAMARAQRALAKNREALKSYYLAFSLIEMQALYITVDDLKVMFLEDDRQMAHRELASLLLLMGKDEEAFDVYEHARSRATLDLLAESSRSRKKQATPEQLENLKALASAIAHLSKLIKDPRLSEQERLKSQAELKKAQERRKNLLQEIQLGQLRRFTKPATLKQVQAAMLGPDDVLIEIFLSESRSNAWIITSRSFTSIALPGSEEIEEKVLRYIEAISAEPNALYMGQALTTQRELAKQLFDLLLGSSRRLLAPDSRLIVVADGVLCYLPFDTLVNNEKYLIEDHSIVYVPSASVLGLLQQRAMSRVMNGKLDLLAFGNPAFAVVGKPDGDRKGNSKAGAAQSYQPTYLPPLLGSEREVKEIGALFPPDRGRIYLGKHATEEALKGEQLRRYRRIHFATHGLSDERIPVRSCLVFARGKNPKEDGFLQVSEIVELDLECDLVVLSACRTGRGKLLRGEGIVGLARAFLYSGAQSCIVTLRAVSDVATADFMIGFYKHLTADAGTALALRQAKLEMLAGKLTRHPYYWAFFVLIGASN